MKRYLLLILTLLPLLASSEIAYGRLHIDFSVLDVEYVPYYVPVDEYVVVERYHRVRRPRYRCYREYYCPVEIVEEYYVPHYCDSDWYYWD